MKAGVGSIPALYHIFNFGIMDFFLGQGEEGSLGGLFVSGGWIGLDWKVWVERVGLLRSRER